MRKVEQAARVQYSHTEWCSISYKRQYEINKHLIWISDILIGRKTRIYTKSSYMQM